MAGDACGSAFWNWHSPARIGSGPGPASACLYLLGLLLLVRPAFGAQPIGLAPPRKIKTFLENCERSRRGAIVELEQQLRGVRSGRIRPKDRQRRIREIELD